MHTKSVKIQDITIPNNNSRQNLCFQLLLESKIMPCNQETYIHKSDF